MNLQELAERQGFEPWVQLLTVQRFSKLTPSRPVAWIQSVSIGISAVVRVKSAHLVIFMHLYMHLFLILAKIYRRFVASAI